MCFLFALQILNVKHSRILSIAVVMLSRTLKCSVFSTYDATFPPTVFSLLQYLSAQLSKLDLCNLDKSVILTLAFYAF